MRGLFLLFAALLAACSSQSPTPEFHAESNPKSLSKWGQIEIRSGDLVLAEQAFAYDLNTPLFSDYAHKLRTIWLPDGQKAAYNSEDTFDFPVGTVITKTFYYPVDGADMLKTDVSPKVINQKMSLDNIRLIETRLLIHRAEGWIALPYVWDDAQTQATLKRTGDLKRLTLKDGHETTDFTYLVPNQNQCAGCHATNNTTRKIQPIGPKARHLNNGYQLQSWITAGHLDKLPDDAPQNANWTDLSHSLDDRARSYLDINCSHCHNEVGPADTSGLHLETDDIFGLNTGLCKLPIAAGTGTGNRKYDIVPGKPDESIFSYRMASTNPAEMMPELGRALAHDEGVKLIDDWIAGMEGECGT